MGVLINQLRLSETRRKINATASTVKEIWIYINLSLKFSKLKKLGEIFLFQQQHQ